MRRFIGVKDVAGILGVSAATVRNWTNAGDIPHVRLPKGHRRYSEAVVRDFAWRNGLDPAVAGLRVPEAADHAEPSTADQAAYAEGECFRFTADLERG